MRSNLKYISLGVGALAIACAVFLIVVANSSSQIESASHVSRVDWLPLSASDITYARRKGFGWFLTYECSLPEMEFQSLAKKEGWPVQEATNVPVGGLRLNLRLQELTNVLGEPVLAIDRAFLFEDRQPNGGGTTVVYDRE